MKYINADKLCEDLINRWEIADKEKEKEIQSIMADIVTPIVIGQPPADVIPSDEIVRCKNCIYARQNETFPEKYECRFSSTLRKKDDFCSEGETEEDYQ